jgi:hypothetical protein
VNDELERRWKESVVAYLRNFPVICLEELRNITKKLSYDNRSPSSDLNPEPPEYEAG